MDSVEQLDDFLMHYGVLGMKWGKRKARRSSSTTEQPKQRRMSNKELKARINRIKLEKEFAQLSAPPKTQSKIDTIVKAAGTMAALTGSAAAIYTNLDKISKAVKTARAVTGN